ncbi:hypothetical protein J7E38_18135 [Bacillus sp. ISL-35]|uniref:hypothetical protein n=1 Tax=Bacillus sp. ISL-35 TaxID=2819122 RepID=UPI001BEAB79D|nr:hypothetical protein [Bacillus sp. ISL-35]MBT2680914.1 hypothetical protein [Bacillus sp. ISL-35]MBT2705230.1 hypothetical protein [Chryseobacterium sp. ISL-80]
MNNRFLTLFLLLTVILLGGCKEEVSSKGKDVRINFDTEESLIVQELSNENAGEYQQIKEITDKEKVDTFFNILSNARWEDSLGKSSYPDFMINSKYSIWTLTPNNNLRVQINNLDKNTFLSESDSKTIYKLLFNEN